VRKLAGLGVLGLVLFIVSPARGQQRTSAFAGINPADIKNQPINVSQALVAPLPTAQGSGFSLTNLMPHFSLTNLFTGAHYGTSPLPPVSSFPSTHYKNSFQPVAPIIPKQ
jgi:hypothetical protein